MEHGLLSLTLDSLYWESIYRYQLVISSVTFCITISQTAFHLRSKKTLALTSWGCWGPWCLHTCGRYSSCRGGCYLLSTVLALGSWKRTCDRCAWTHRPHCQSRTPAATIQESIFLWTRINVFKLNTSSLFSQIFSWEHNRLLIKKTTSYIFKENMKLFVFLWINCGLKQRKEYVFQHLGKIRYQLLRLENITETNTQTKKVVLYFVGNFQTS